MIDATRLIPKAPTMCSQQFTSVLFLLKLLVCVTWAMPVSAGVIVNGNFATPGVGAPFAQWTTATGLNAPTDGGAFARFVAGETEEVGQLSQMFDLPGGSQELTFEYRLRQAAGGSPTGNFSDSLSAVLFDGGLTPISPIDSFLPGFFYVEPTSSGPGFQESFTPSGVTTVDLGNGWRRVTLSLPSLPPGPFTFGFLSRSDSDGRTTTFDIDNVSIVQDVGAIPEPASVAVWGILSFGFLPTLRKNRRG